MTFWEWVIIIAGFLFSFFYGFFAVQIFLRNELDWKTENILPKDTPFLKWLFNEPTKYTLYTPKGEEKPVIIKHTLGWYLHQVWINLAGSAIGWTCAFILYRDITLTPLKDLTTAHLILFLIGTLGVMGFLPLTFHGIAATGQYITSRLGK